MKQSPIPVPFIFFVLGVVLGVFLTLHAPPEAIAAFAPDKVASATPQDDEGEQGESAYTGAYRNSSDAEIRADIKRFWRLCGDKGEEDVNCRKLVNAQQAAIDRGMSPKSD